MEQEIEKNEIPYSQGMYFLSGYNIVVNARSEELKVVTRDGEKYVFLDWYDGYREYSLGFLVCITHYRVHLPVEYWSRIIVKYIDGNKSNLFPSNLYYCFDSPIEVRCLKGFFYVPYYTQWCVNRNGDVADPITGRLRSKHIQKPPKNNPKNITGGYVSYYFNVRNDRFKFLARHRAIGLTFIEYATSPFLLVMNHKDGIPGHDVIENLEWVTKRDNMLHALRNGLMPNSTRKLIGRHIDDLNKEIKFSSIVEAKILTGINEACVARRVVESPAIIRDDGWLFKDANAEWPLFHHVRKSKTGGHCVIGKNVFTGELIRFANIHQASELTGVNIGAIQKFIKLLRLRPMHGFVFHYEGDDAPWPEFSEKDLEVYRRHPTSGGCGVVAETIEGEPLGFYGSVNTAAKELGYSPAQIFQTAKGQRKTTGKKFHLYHPKY